MVSGSIEWENHWRLENLFKKHHNQLKTFSKQMSSGDTDLENDIVGDLYLYLTKPNPKIWFADSFNLIYCKAFINSRILNWKQREKRMIKMGERRYDLADTEYDDTLDKRIDEEYNKLIEHLNQKKKEKGWQSYMLFEIYHFGENTMQELSSKIGLSKSTIFLNTRKVKRELKETLNNPFRKEEDEND